MPVSASGIRLVKVGGFCWIMVLLLLLLWGLAPRGGAIAAGPDQECRVVAGIAVVRIVISSR
jgi:hypothetical protein